MDVANSTRTDGQVFVRAGSLSFGATAPTVTGGTFGIVSRFSSTAWKLTFAAAPLPVFW